MPSPKFITFEGVEGSGKTTQANLLAERIRKELYNGHPGVLQTREPGDGPIGPQIRSIVLDIQNKVPPMAELLLMMADRAQHVLMIKDFMALGGSVVCDRYADCSMAYQGYGRGLSLSTIGTLNDIATGVFMPDVTFLIDMDPSIGLSRARFVNRMELETLDFHKRVRAGYLELAHLNKKRIKIIDGVQSLDKVHEDIWEITKELFKESDGLTQAINQSYS